MRRPSLFAIAFTLALAACNKVDSENILSSGIYGSISARAAGAGSTTVSATLFLESPLTLDFIELGADDELVATQGATAKTMTETDVLNVVSYHATFPTEAEGTLFEVAFLRTVDAGAPSSTVALPAPLTLTVLPAPTVSRAAALTVQWSASAAGDSMSWSAAGDCIDSASGGIAGDPGTLTLPANTLVKRMGTMVADSCPVALTVTRRRDGQLDPGYGKGGTIVGEQTRQATFTSQP